MGKALLLIVLSVSIGLGIFLVQSVQSGVVQSDVRLHAYGEEVIAREVALTGLSVAVTTVSEAYATERRFDGPWEFEGDFDAGRYRVQIAWEDSLLVFSSIGMVGNATKHVRQAYRTRAQELPPFATQAVLSEMHIQVRSPFQVTAPPNVNGNVHSNMHLQFNTVDALIQGFGSTSMQAQLGGVGSWSSIFQPNVNPDLLPVLVERAPRIPFPEQDLAQYRSRADLVMRGGNHLAGPLMLGTAANPKVIFIDGDFQTAANVTISGHGIIIATGHARINHSITATGADGDTRILWIIGHHVDVAGDIEMTGGWHVRGKFEATDPLHIVNGSLITGHLLQIRAPLSITYRRIPLPFADILWPDHIVARSYREW